MQQKIHAEQLRELTAEGMRRYADYSKRKGWTTQSDKESFTIPNWNIGQMIEFLSEEQINQAILDDDDFVIINKDKICVALWNECIITLNV